MVGEYTCMYRYYSSGRVLTEFFLASVRKRLTSCASVFPSQISIVPIYY